MLALADAEPGTVVVSHMERALQLGDYYLAHAGALLESWATGSTGATGAALRLLARLRAELAGGGLERVGGWAAAGGRGGLVHGARCVALGQESGRGHDPRGAGGAGGARLRAPGGCGFGFGEPGRRVAKKSPVVLVNPALEFS